MSKALDKQIESLQDVSAQIRDVSYSLKALGHLVLNADPESPPDFADVEGLGCILKNLSERCHLLAWNIDTIYLSQASQASNETRPSETTHLN